MAVMMVWVVWKIRDSTRDLFWGGKKVLQEKAKGKGELPSLQELEDSNGQVGLKYTKPQRGKGP